MEVVDLTASSPPRAWRQPARVADDAAMTAEKSARWIALLKLYLRFFQAYNPELINTIIEKLPWKHLLSPLHLKGQALDTLEPNLIGWLFYYFQEWLTHHPSIGSIITLYSRELNDPLRRRQRMEQDPMSRPEVVAIRRWLVHNFKELGDVDSREMMKCIRARCPAAVKPVPNNPGRQSIDFNQVSQASLPFLVKDMERVHKERVTQLVAHNADHPLPVPALTDLHNAVSAASAEQLQQAVLELSVLSPALGRAMLRCLAPESRFSRSTVLDAATEAAVNRVNPEAAAASGSQEPARTYKPTGIQAAVQAQKKKDAEREARRQAAASLDQSSSPEEYQRAVKEEARAARPAQPAFRRPATASSSNNRPSGSSTASSGSEEHHTATKTETSATTAQPAIRHLTNTKPNGHTTAMPPTSPSRQIRRDALAHRPAAAAATAAATPAQRLTQELREMEERRRNIYDRVGPETPTPALRAGVGVGADSSGGAGALKQQLYQQQLLAQQLTQELREMEERRNVHDKRGPETPTPASGAGGGAGGGDPVVLKMRIYQLGLLNRDLEQEVRKLEELENMKERPNVHHSRGQETPTPASGAGGGAGSGGAGAGATASATARQPGGHPLSTTIGPASASASTPASAPASSGAGRHIITPRPRPAPAPSSSSPAMPRPTPGRQTPAVRLPAQTPGALRGTSSTRTPSSASASASASVQAQAPGVKQENDVDDAFAAFQGARSAAGSTPARQGERSAAGGSAGQGSGSGKRRLSSELSRGVAEWGKRVRRG